MNHPRSRALRCPAWKLRGSAALALALASTSLPACSKRGIVEEKPVAQLAASKQAKDDFRHLGQRWLVGTRKERQELEVALADFRERHAGDELSRIASVYLAWNAIERGEFARARELVAKVLEGPSGSTHDFATVARAAILEREGDAPGALSLLQPLVGKVIEPHARALFTRELVGAAIASGRYYEAVGYMDMWLQQGDGDDRERARRQMRRALDLIPPEVARSIARAPAESGYSEELRRALVARLEGSGDDAEDFSLRDTAQIEGRTVGLLLSLGSPLARARGAEALSGVLSGLGLPQAQAETRLITSDDGGDPSKTEAALTQLARQGAAIVIAGLDPQQAAIAARFAERTSIPVLLLAIPEGDPVRPASAFLVAGGEEGIPAKLSEALSARGAKKLAWVGSAADMPSVDPSSQSLCDGATEAGEPRFPVASWKKGKVDGLLVLGPPSCADEVTDALRESRLSPIAGVGLDAAAHLAWEPKKIERLLLPTAGRFPIRGGDESSPLAAWVERYGSPPSYLSAIARDAAVLAEAALSTLPNTKLTDPGDVAWRYVETTKALEKVERELWTTHAGGFGSAHVLAREVRIMEIE